MSERIFLYAVLVPNCSLMRLISAMTHTIIFYALASVWRVASHPFPRPFHLNAFNSLTRLHNRGFPEVHDCAAYDGIHIV